MTAFDEWNKNLIIARQEGRVEGHREGSVPALREAVLTFGNPIRDRCN